MKNFTKHALNIAAILAGGAVVAVASWKRQENFQRIYEGHLLTGDMIEVRPFNPGKSTNWVVVTNHPISDSLFEVIATDGKYFFVGFRGSSIPVGRRVQFKSVIADTPSMINTVEPIE